MKRASCILWNCVVYLADQRSLPVFLFTFVIHMQEAFWCSYSTIRLKYRVNFFILGNSVRLNILIFRGAKDRPVRILRSFLINNALYILMVFCQLQLTFVIHSFTARIITDLVCFSFFPPSKYDFIDFRERERDIGHTFPTGYRSHNPGMCPDQN